MTAAPSTTASLLARRARVLGPAYRLFYDDPVHLVRGEGVWLHDADGKRYLDAYNNVACVGHAHPRVVQAIARQAAVLNTHTRYLHEGVVDYAERLLRTAPGMDHAMFTCTGSEANDLALRIARAHTQAQGLIVTDNAYHGVTAAIAEASPSLGRYIKLGPAVRTVAPPDTRHGDAAAVGARFAQSVREAAADLRAHGLAPAALLVDTIFSTDGIHADPAGFLAPAVQAIHEEGGLFIADEVQPGFGRGGDTFWGYQRHGVAPDLVTMGKPMGNGHPVAGLMTRADVLAAFGRECRYFNTFGGNPVSMAAAGAVLDVIEDEGLRENARVVGDYLRARLRELSARHPVVADVRGAGLFVGLELSEERSEGPDRAPATDLAARVVNGLRRQGILLSATGAAGNVLKIRPPLVFQREHADLLADGIGAALAACGA
ncbi:aspartate aminotransferase family protein [Bordetella genomosp. 10]|uniref:Aspartate aminotransferase family protein n=1 Tax=Bordetella genomosp. 10 TaxID=1416804 RepID=A0A261RZY4_9BORD|nr:aspartate aminotransferase family protein [Bordetella genomosp. 10]OZI30327.1 aspartate aminotransferase family protein [Bordetella genomosp. 10]